MRDYKFRGWSTDFNKWVYGYACFSPNKERAVIIHKHGNNDMQHTDVVPESVGEFTGLSDKNGAEIYEGDILQKTGKMEMTGADPRFKIVGSIKKVVFHEASFRLTQNNKSKKYHLASQYIRYYGFEIFGNIYQNIELLTNK